MKFYYFGGHMRDRKSVGVPSSLEENNFSGVMFTHDIPEGDMLVRMARELNDNEKIKYLIAIRPYTISPQYLSMINKSMSEISKDRLQINFISGYTKDYEASVGGIVGDVNDNSSSRDKSNYMIEFIKTLNEMQKDETNKIDFYVSTTNEYVFDVVKRYNNKIILPYGKYKRGTWTDHNINKDPSENDTFDISNTEVMIALTPIIRENEKELELLSNYALRPVWKKGEIPKVVGDVEYFTYETFDDFVKTLEAEGINHLLINAVPPQEAEVIIPFIKRYVESRQQSVGDY